MYSGAPNMEGSDKNLRHPGVWGQGYRYFRRKDGREGSRNDGGGAGVTGGMTSSLPGRDDVAHLLERWATRSSPFVIPARTSRMTHAPDALRRL